MNSHTERIFKRLQEVEPLAIPVTVRITAVPGGIASRAAIMSNGTSAVIELKTGLSPMETEDALIHEWSHLHHKCDKACCGHDGEWGRIYARVYRNFHALNGVPCKAPKRPAASVIVPWGDRFVGITRGTEVADVCFPGGMGDPEDGGPQATGARELREETGIVVNPADLEEVLVRPDGGHITYYAHRIVSFPQVLQSNPFEGYPGAYPAQAFVAPSSRYRATAAEAFRRLAQRQRPTQRNPMPGYEQLRRRLLR